MPHVLAAFRCLPQGAIQRATCGWALRNQSQAAPFARRDEFTLRSGVCRASSLLCFNPVGPNRFASSTASLSKTCSRCDLSLRVS